MVSTNFTLEVYDYDFGKGLILFEKPQIFKEKPYNEEENHWIYNLARDHHCGHLIYCGKEDNRSLLIREQSRTEQIELMMKVLEKRGKQSEFIIHY